VVPTTMCIYIRLLGNFAFDGVGGTTLSSHRGR